MSRGSADKEVHTLTLLSMARADEVVSHWHHSVENFNTSTLEFFKAIETTLSVKDAPVRPERIDYHESGVLSAKREYLRVSYARYSFDIGAAPFGRDFFFSWWMVRRVSDGSLMLGCLGLVAMPFIFAILAHFAGWFLGAILSLAAFGGALYWAGNAAGRGPEVVEDAILGLPLIGRLYARFIRPVTYYSEDTRRMFEETVHRVVLANVSGLLSIAKLPALSQDEAKPKER